MKFKLNSTFKSLQPFLKIHKQINISMYIEDKESYDIRQLTQGIQV